MKRLLFLLLFVNVAFVRAQVQQDPTQMVQQFNIHIDNLGDADFEVSAQMNQQQWLNFKQGQLASDPAIARRDMQRAMSAYVIENFKRDLDEMNRTVKMTFRVKAMATYRGNGKWDVRLDSKNPQVTKLADNSYMMTSNQYFNGQLTQQVFKVFFPSSAGNIQQSTDSFSKAMFTYANGGGISGLLTVTNIGGLLLVIGAVIAYFLLRQKKGEIKLSKVVVHAPATLLICFLSLSASAQTDIMLKGDTLILPSGARFWLGEEITIGVGTAPDKSFNFIYEPGLVSFLKRKPLGASYYNKKAVIRRFEKDANYKRSYAYNILVLDFGDKHKYWCDVRGAIDNNELLTGSPAAVVGPKGGTGPVIF